MKEKENEAGDKKNEGRNDGDEQKRKRGGRRVKEGFPQQQPTVTCVTHYCPPMSSITVLIYSGGNVSAASGDRRMLQTHVALNMWGCCFYCCNTALSLSY